MIASAPENDTVANVVASSNKVGGVCRSWRNALALKTPIAVTTRPARAVRTVPAATLRRTPAGSFAPKACAVGIANPVVMPHEKPIRRKKMPPVLPTAANASTPRFRPTTTASITWYICWTTFPTSRGMAKMRITRHGLPAVRDFDMQVSSIHLFGAWPLLYARG